MTIRYLNCEICVPGYGDCSNGGISHYFQTVALACPNGPLSFESEEVTPRNFCVLDARHVGYWDTLLTIYPAMVEDGEVKKRPGWWMFGGCYVGGSDSRFGELCKKAFGLEFFGAVKLFDRMEGRR